MAERQLKPAAKAGIQKASSAGVQLYLANLSRGRGSSWLPAISKFPSGEIPSDGSFATIDAGELTAAVAVRGPLHCIDGWSYLGKSVAALSSGCPHTARHLAYYAELRAALSVLASQGIGNFNTKNISIDAAGGVTHLPDCRTHDMAWLALVFWSEQPSAFDAILSSMDIGGVSFLDVVRDLFPSPSKQTLGSRIVRSWGLDLNIARNDQRDRNRSSYSPNELLDLETKPEDDLTFTSDMWRSFEPESYRIERYLLRSLIDQQSTDRQDGVSLSERHAEFGRLDPRIHTLFSFDFLTRQTDPEDHRLQREAARTEKPAPASAMISRAGLLLRLATGLVNQNFTAASVSPLNDLEFWWHRFGASKGFWPTSAPIDLPIELWQDIQFALEDAQEREVEDRFSYVSSAPANSTRLHELERVGLWSFCRE